MKFLAGYLLIGLIVLGWTGSISARNGKIDEWTGRSTLLTLVAWPVVVGILAERAAP